MQMTLSKPNQLLALACGIVLTWSGCQCGPGGKSCKIDGDCPSGQVCSKNVCQPGATLGDGGFVGGDGGVVDSDIVGIEISPRDVVLTTALGMPVPANFTATLRRSDGSTLPAGSTVLWSLNTRTIGDVNGGSGAFLATGVQAGQVTLIATVTTRAGTMVKDSTTITVKINKDTVGTGVPPDIAMTFPMPTPGTAAQAAGLVYPLNNALMPQNVFAADIQWLVGNAGDVFRVTMSKPNIKLVTYFKAADGTNHFLPEAAEWRAFVQSDADAEGEITVDRWPAGAGPSYSGTPVKVKFARAALSGSVYFWEVASERLLRIDDGTNQAVAFLNNKPIGCAGCHTVSPSGRYISVRFNSGNGYGSVFDLTVDLSGPTPPSLYPIDRTRYFFSTWSPSETRLLVNRWVDSVSGLELLDPKTGAVVPVMGGTPLPQAQATHPNWSRDGTSVAYVGNYPQSGDWGTDYTGGTINLLSVTNEQTFTAPQPVLTAAAAPDSAEFKTLAYPQFTPDSQRIVYAHHSGNARASGKGRLEMVSKDGTGATVLATASGPEVSAFEPRMSPFDAGGYFWVAYLSRRDYGNNQVGTRGTATSMIWVSGIKKNPMPGEDPSAVGYWLPGQDPKKGSISAYWAAKACRATGADCSVNSECCSEECRPPVTGGAPVCSPPPPDRCRMEGQTCGGAGDCCPGLECKVNSCVKVDDGIN
jgi:hypothetical protein